ncbi:GDSL esterase/lipase 1 [Ricinus communis]|uniref:GDSL esterase/lipase 1 n=1 Tax=Ricinus communis TaxID=3988 RepID=UPI00201B26F7|nr:GDSL esterase/lipase 1 [Ricinus communis]
MYLNVPLWKPYLAPGTQNLLHGANFAGGGAAALDEYSYSGTIPFSEQLRFFEEVASFLKQQLSDEEAMKILKEAVYLSSLGGIDYLTFTGTYLNATEAEIEEFINMVVGNITDGVKKIYAIGGRKFAFQNVGPLGCMPIVRKLFGLTNDSCYEDLLYIASLHNDALANATKELESQLPGFKYLIYDYYSLLLQRIENPSDYGFIEGVSACCGNGTYLGSGCGIEPYELCSDPSEFVWFDGGHPTEQTNAQLARLVWEGGPDASTPYNLKQLYDLEVSDEISSSECYARLKFSPESGKKMTNDFDIVNFIFMFRRWKNYEIKETNMSNLTSFHLSFLFIFACLLMAGKSHADHSRQAATNVVMFVFGDSLFDPGNNNDLNVSIIDKANRWPYGESFFNVPTGRFCDGRLIPDFIAEYANIPLWTPYMQTEGSQQFINGANFAAGGSGVLSETDPGSLDLKTQVKFFKTVVNQLRQELGAEEVKKMLTEAVYLSSTGGNDYIGYTEDYPNAAESEQEEFVKMVVGNLTGVIKEIYEMGGRKFAFQNVGPIGCTPISKQMNGLIGDECDEESLELARLHNNALLEAIVSLQSQLQGFKYLVFDYYTLLYNITRNPSKYGFQVADVACCGSGTNNAIDCGIPPYELCSNVSDYVFFDGAHPSEKVNEELAKLLWDGEPPFTKPSNMKHLLKLETESHLLSENHSLLIDE